MGIRRRLVTLFFRNRVRREMNEEMQAHLDSLVEQQLAAGVPLQEARLAAAREFGGAAQAREAGLDEVGGRWLEECWRDLLLALRGLRRHPLFSIVAVTSLALAIGASTSVFSLVNGMLLSSLPVPKPEQLRVITWSYPQHPLPVTMVRAKPEMLASLQVATAEAAEVFGCTGLTSVNARGESLAFSTQGLAFTGNAMEALGARPLLGRTLVRSDDLPGAGPVVVIGYRMWADRLGKDEQIIGRTLKLNDAALTIVGVMQENFRGVDDGASSEFFVALESAGAIEPSLGRGARAVWPIVLMARLRPGATEAQLAAQIESGTRTWSPQTTEERPELVLLNGSKGVDWSRSYYRETLTLLSFAVGFLMLVACANLAGLSVVRGIYRTREHAVRAALGAGKTRLIRSALLESLVLAALGALGGTVLTWILQTPLERLVAGTSEGLYYDTSVDLRVMGFAIGLAFLTAFLSGILPGLRAAQVDPIRGLKTGGFGTTQKTRVIRGLVILQVGVSVLLLVGTGLYVRSLQNLLSVDPGFPIENRLVFRLKTREHKPEAVYQFHERVHESVQALPGIRQITTADMKPLLGVPPKPARYLVETAEGAKQLDARRVVIGRAFFQTMGIPLVAGRPPYDGEKNVMVVSQALAKQMGGAEKALHSVVQSADKKTKWQVVGISQDALLSGIRMPAFPVAYITLADSPQTSMYYLIGGKVRPELLLEDVRKAIARIDEEVAPAGVAMQLEIRAKNLRRERLVATLVTSLAGMALFLSMIGLYGVVSFGVARRVPEFGLRMALGATARDISGPILRDAFLLAAGGVTIGLLGSLGAGRYLASSLYGMSPYDPLILVAAPLVFVLVSLLAAYVPSRRAAKVDPLVALRAE